jgi:hypothetical protein
MTTSYLNKEIDSTSEILHTSNSQVAIGNVFLATITQMGTLLTRQTDRQLGKNEMVLLLL